MKPLTDMQGISSWRRRLLRSGLFWLALSVAAVGLVSLRRPLHVCIPVAPKARILVGAVHTHLYAAFVRAEVEDRSEAVAKLDRSIANWRNHWAARHMRRPIWTWPDDAFSIFTIDQPVYRLVYVPAVPVVAFIVAAVAAWRWISRGGVRVRDLLREIRRPSDLGMRRQRFPRTLHRLILGLLALMGCACGLASLSLLRLGNMIPSIRWVSEDHAESDEAAAAYIPATPPNQPIFDFGVEYGIPQSRDASIPAPTTQPIESVRKSPARRPNIESEVQGGTLHVRFFRAASRSEVINPWSWSHLGLTLKKQMVIGAEINPFNTSLAYQPPDEPVDLFRTALSEGLSAVNTAEIWISISLWWFALLLLTFPLLRLVRGPVRRARRVKQGQCPRCGYSLTGLPQPRCPECGLASLTVPLSC